MAWGRATARPHTTFLTPRGGTREGVTAFSQRSLKRPLSELFSCSAQAFSASGHRPADRLGHHSAWISIAGSSSGDVPAREACGARGSVHQEEISNRHPLAFEGHRNQTPHRPSSGKACADLETPLAQRQLRGEFCSGETASGAAKGTELHPIDRSSPVKRLRKCRRKYYVS